MAERSGLDMLEEVLLRMDRLEKQNAMMERLIKQIANSAKISELTQKTMEKMVREKVSKARAEPFDPTKMLDVSKEKSGVVQKKKIKSCACQGNLIIQDGKKEIPLPDMHVMIMNDRDELIKETKTNRAGAWMAWLPPGKYVMFAQGEYHGQEVYPVNINFEVKEGVESLKVQ